MLTIGLDAHLNSSQLHILDANGKKIKSQHIAGHWKKAVDVLGSLDQPFRLCYEASCGYGSIYDHVASLPNARDITVAHPGKLRLIYQSKRKNDQVDAEQLAKLQFLDMVPKIHVPDVDVRDWRGLIEHRRRSVDKRTRAKNGIRALLRTYGVVKPRAVGGLWTRKGLAWLQSLSWDSLVAKLRCQELIEELDQHEKSIKRITRELDEIGKSQPGVQLLKTIPGVGPRTAEAIMAYIDDPDRFARSKQIGCYFGLVPRQDSSGYRNRLGHITKDGPPTARKLLVEATWQGIRRNRHLRDYFDRIAGGKPDRRKVALVATAHHVLRCMLAMLKTGEVWRHTEPVGKPTQRKRATAA